MARSDWLRLAKAVVSLSDGWTFGLGLTIGCSVTAIVLAALLLLSARNVMRHRTSDNAYWRRLQANRRPQFILASRAILAIAALTAVVAGSTDSRFVIGVATVPGLLAGIAVIAERTGGIRPY